jgi:hypothetical protein
VAAAPKRQLRRRGRADAALHQLLLLLLLHQLLRLLHTASHVAGGC